MGNITEGSNWVPNIYQLETTDVVVGGDPLSGGTANIQAQQLATRTSYLKNRISTFNGIQEISDSSTLSFEAIVDRLLVVAPNSNTVKVNILINGVMGGTMAVGHRLAILVKDVAALGSRKAVEFELRNIATVCNILGQNALSTGNLFLYEGETVTLVYLGSNTFQILDTNVNFGEIGDIDYKANIFLNGVIGASGQIVNRRSFPRLWALAQSAAISDSLWQSNIQNSGKFSTGDGSTTFRLPDLRGVFIRGLDLSRGLDINRGADQGVYLHDSVRSHLHKFSTLRGTIKIENPNNIALSERGIVSLVSINSGNSYYSNIDTNTQNNTPSSVETSPKSTAYIAYIKY